MTFAIIASVLWFAAGYVARGCKQEHDKGKAFIQGYSSGVTNTLEEFSDDQLRDKLEVSAAMEEAR